MQGRVCLTTGLATPVQEPGEAWGSPDVCEAREGCGGLRPGPAPTPLPQGPALRPPWLCPRPELLAHGFCWGHRSWRLSPGRREGGPRVLGAQRSRAQPLALGAGWGVPPEQSLGRGWGPLLGPEGLVPGRPTGSPTLCPPPWGSECEALARTRTPQPRRRLLVLAWAQGRPRKPKVTPPTTASTPCLGSWPQGGHRAPPGDCAERLLPGGGRGWASDLLIC